VEVASSHDAIAARCRPHGKIDSAGPGAVGAFGTLEKRLTPHPQAPGLKESHRQDMALISGGWLEIGRRPVAWLLLK
jgi:hypothetical protein